VSIGNVTKCGRKEPVEKTRDILIVPFCYTTFYPRHFVRSPLSLEQLRLAVSDYFLMRPAVSKRLDNT